ncbi:MAG: DeoR family transcriptional regulator [Gemmatimonadetes bacterium]|nr:DeoR family transcriptional regulator [Gemmatimonadota bacterium]
MLIEQQVTNERLRELTGVHSSDLTTLLRRLVANAFLDRHGPNRGAYYQLPVSTAVVEPVTADLFGGATTTSEYPGDRPEAGAADGLNPRQIKALEWVESRGIITTAEYKALVDVNRRTVTRDLNDLVDRGLLRRLRRGV